MNKFGKKREWEEIIRRFYKDGESTEGEGLDYEHFVEWLVEEEGFEDKKEILEGLWNRDELVEQESSSFFVGKVVAKLNQQPRNDSKNSTKTTLGKVIVEADDSDDELLEEEELELVSYQTRPLRQECWETIEGLCAEAESAQKVNNKQKGKNKKSMKKNSPRHRAVIRVAAVVIPLILIVGGASIWFAIRNNFEAQFAEHNTPSGKIEQVVLPDGSKVCMNSGSKLSFVNQSGEKRQVVLEGESFFSVKADRKARFEIATKELNIGVVGTEFNVEAYPERETTVVTLTRGEVEIDNGAGGAWRLTPQKNRLIYDNTTKEGRVVSAEGINHEGFDWRDGDLVVDNLTLPEILVSLERAFGIEFNVESKVIFSDDRYVLIFNRDDSPEYIMSVLKNLTGEFDYRIEADNLPVNIF